MTEDLAEANTIISMFIQYKREVPDRIGTLDPQAVVDAWVRHGEPIRNKVIVFNMAWLNEAS
jgi:hypothetical protein